MSVRCFLNTLSYANITGCYVDIVDKLIKQELELQNEQTLPARYDRQRNRLDVSIFPFNTGNKFQ